MNPYASPYRRAVISAYLRRAGGSDYHPSKAARIARRYDRVLTYSKAVGCDGSPLRNSWWRRKQTGWIRQILSASDETVRVYLPGTQETEIYFLPRFLDYFEPLP